MITSRLHSLLLFFIIVFILPLPYPTRMGGTSPYADLCESITGPCTLMASTGGDPVPADYMMLVHDANAVALAVTNSGQSGNDIITGNGLGGWPAWTSNNYIFGTGIWIGGLADVDGDGTKDTVVVQGYDTLSGASEHREGRVGQDISDPLARVFSSTILDDLVEWPDEFRNSEDDPVFYAAQDFVTIYNDINGTPQFTTGRCGIEVKQRSMAFVGGLNFNAILLSFELTNRSDSLPDGPFTLEEAYIALVSDMDIGESFADDMSSILDSVEVYGREAVELNTGMAWDSDFNEENWEGPVGFVGTCFLQPPGNAWDGIDNDGDGMTDESPFDGVDDDLDGQPDDIPDEVDAVDEFHYTWFGSPSTAPPIQDPTSDEEAYRMMRCLTGDDCGEFDIESDIRYMISYGSFDLPPGESQIAIFAIVFANPVGNPGHLDLVGDPPRPDPQDPMLAEFVATILSTKALYESGFQDVGAPFTIFNTTDFDDTNDPAGPYRIQTNIIDSIPLSRNTLHYSVGGALWDEVDLVRETGNIYTAEIPGQQFWSTVSYYIQAVDSAFQVLRDPWDAPLSTFDFSIVDVPEFSRSTCEECEQSSISASADFDLDGLVDIFLLTSNGPALLRNTGEFIFEDVTESAGIEASSFARGASWGDYDNDGYPDLFIGVYSSGNTHLLFHNSGDGTFENTTELSGVSDTLATSSGIWGDVSGDGYLDLLTLQPLTDRMYINNGDGTFDERAIDFGIDEQGNDRAGTLVDLDGDADLDIILIGGVGNIVYRNSGEGFEDISQQTGIGNTAWLGITIGDYDQDGDADILFSDPGLALFENRSGLGQFLEVTEDLGLSGMSASDAFWADLNNDGYLDIVTTVPAVLIRQPDSTFLDLTGTSGITGGYGLRSFTTYYDDGDDGLLDLVIGDFWENAGYPGGIDRHWFELSLQGTLSDMMAIGARARVFAGDLASTRWVSGGEGKSQDSATLHFGLENHDMIDSLVIDWPSGITQKITAVAADRIYPVVEDSTLDIVGNNSPETVIPRTYALSQNYPNPFNPQTVIRFDIPEGTSSSLQLVRTKLAVFDVRGRLVRKLIDRVLSPGRHSVTWDGTDAHLVEVRSGIYFYRLESGTFRSTRKMALLK